MILLRQRIILKSFLLTLFLPLSTSLLFAVPSRAEEGTKAAVSEDERMLELFRGAGSVFSAEIKSAALEPENQNPVSKIFFENVFSLRGNKPETEKTRYLYAKSPDQLEKFRARRVIVLMEPFEEGKKPAFIRAILPEAPQYFKMLESLDTAACSEEKPVDCAA